MGFSVVRAILAGNTLIAQAIQSQNYVAGSSGWQIAANGNVEFNNGTFRGTLNAGNGAVVVNSTGLAVTASNQLLTITNNGFVVSELPAVGGRLQITTIPGFGGVIALKPDNSNVTGATFVAGEMFASRSEAATSPVTTQPAVSIFSPSVNSLSQSNIALNGQSSAATFDDSVIKHTAQNMQFNTNSNGTPCDIPGGWVGGASTKTSLATVAATETVQLTVLDRGGFQVNWAANRSYKIVISGTAQTSAVATSPLFAVRKLTVTGQVLVGTIRTTQAVASFPYAFTATGYFTIGAANVTGSLVLTLIGATGQTVQVIASATNVFEINVYDDGPATNHPNAPVMV